MEKQPLLARCANENGVNLIDYQHPRADFTKQAERGVTHSPETLPPTGTRPRRTKRGEKLVHERIFGGFVRHTQYNDRSALDTSCCVKRPSVYSLELAQDHCLAHSRLTQQQDVFHPFAEWLLQQVLQKQEDKRCFTVVNPTHRPHTCDACLVIQGCKRARIRQKVPILDAPEVFDLPSHDQSSVFATSSAVITGTLASGSSATAVGCGG